MSLTVLLGTQVTDREYYRTVYLDRIGVEKDKHRIVGASIIRYALIPSQAKVIWD